MPDPIFFDAYRGGPPPWDIGRAQPAFVELANADQITGKVLDLGCGTGDLVMELLERDLDAWGIDIVPMAIDQAKAKARIRGLEAPFLVGNALEISKLGMTFDTVLDCGLFHTFSDPERFLYEEEVAHVLRPGGRLQLMAISDWEDRSWGGPRRVSQQEIIETFRDGWRVDDIREARFIVRPEFRVKAHAWLATLVREVEPPKERKKRATPNAPVKKRDVELKEKGKKAEAVSVA